ncbi:DNA-binding transcriptional ArsR family regulator [Devosia sp. UYZn731]|uniref:ArsR/SmtB family transcription factor n=1 Tax=Devosia sp. UYZn731 TaxID=3156345 RepID=UPI00339AA237
MAHDQLSLTLSAVADPTRRAILARLTQGEASVKELALPFDMSIPAVCKHLKVLEGAGLISRGRNAQLRPCRLEPERLREAAQWLDGYRQFWDESLTRLDGLLDRLQTADEEAKSN